ncbi:hypothetical protein [Micromonospora parva]|uniref:hypothetical protein n=1 Tax=Micromonospora parva TaxID=1464048 RepID=UPI003407E34B
MIWLITVPVAWGVTQFAGGFLQRLGESTAENLATWIATAGSRAKDSHRENLVHVRFETPGGMVVSAYVPLAINSAAAVAELREALENLGPVAQFAGAMAAGEVPDVALSAFFYSADTWNLGWWASPGQVYISPWFSKNYPDPQRFLGHPALADVIEPSTPQQDLPLPPHESG